MTAAALLAMSSALCFGIALVTAQAGLGGRSARSGASISIPSATLVFLLASPFLLDTSGYRLDALCWFAALGVFFPALVTILTFRSNHLLGPTVTSAVSGTAPLFAVLAAAAFLDERVPVAAAFAAAGVTAGIFLISWERTAVPRFTGWQLAWPAAGAVVRGLAQATAKAALSVWPNPFAAALVCYVVSSGVVLAADTAGTTGEMPWRSRLWLVATGLLNGGAVLLMYMALARAPVSLVAPIVAAYPLVTAVTSVFIVRMERAGARTLWGAVIMVAAIALLVASTDGP